MWLTFAPSSRARGVTGQAQLPVRTTQYPECLAGKLFVSNRPIFPAR